jgi:KRAB domain-containing zinc finger protein
MIGKNMLTTQPINWIKGEPCDPYEELNVPHSIENWFPGCKKTDDHCPCCRKKATKRKPQRTTTIVDKNNYKQQTKGKPELINCKWCDYKAIEKSILSQHMRNVHKICKTDQSRTVQCSMCEYKTKAKSKMMVHLKEVHDIIQPMKCEFCIFQTDNVQSLANHLRFHKKTSKSVAKCAFCDFKINGKVRMKLHISEVHGDPNNDEPLQLIQCEICSYQAVSLQSLTRHQISHKPVKCLQCGYEAQTSFDLKIHRRKHKPRWKPGNICEKCGFKAHKRRIQTHVCEPIKCPNCDFETQLAYNMICHKKTVHGNMFNCDQCQYKSERKGNVDKHIQNVHQRFRLDCDHCERKFTQDCDLRKHVLNVHGIQMMKKVTRASVLKCKTCGYKSKLCKSFENHKCEALKCEWCDFETKLEFHLNRHKIKVHKEKVLFCHICQYQSKDAHHFINHKRIHSNRPGRGFNIDCLHCDSKFKHDTDLKKHTESVHGQAAQPGKIL